MRWSTLPLGIALALAACGATLGDRDADGLLDAADACPDEAEDMDGFEDDDGCYDADNDGDGVPDAPDLCPEDPEDEDGFEDDDGCPDPDDDQDRLLDVDDQCPREPETYNGIEDDDGCPDEGELVVYQCSFPIADVFFFARGSANVPPEVHPVLDAVVATLEGNPDVQRVAVVGHTALGEAPRLAAERATAVVEALVARGVPREHFTVFDANARDPVLADEPASVRNQRVTLDIVRRDGLTVGTWDGARIVPPTTDD